MMFGLGDRHIHTNEWKLPELARTFLISCEYESGFELRTGNHIEERPGMVNFSVVGRNANLDERAKYVAWDKENGERHVIANAFNTMFPECEACVAGETGIDIIPKGSDKSQILKDFDVIDELCFLGDKMEHGGNDYTLALAIARSGGVIRQVKNWSDTWEYLKDL